MTAEKQVTASAEFIQNFARYKEAIAILGLTAINLASLDGAVVQLRQGSERPQESCIAQACGSLGVDDLLLSSQNNHFKANKLDISKEPLPQPHTNKPSLAPSPSYIPHLSSGAGEKATVSSVPSAITEHPRVVARSKEVFRPFDKSAADTKDEFIDGSWPQCQHKHPERIRSDLPTKVAGAIIGINDGKPATTNRCLASQLSWANKAGPTELYVNSFNDGVKNPWQYGWKVAKDDITKRLLPAIKRAKLAVKPTDYKIVWLDVEGGWHGSHSQNRKVLEGMTTYFKNFGLKVGLYSVNSVTSPRDESTSYFHRIVGKVPESSNLSGLPSWLAQGNGYEGAVEACRYLPLTPNSKVVMTQYVKHNLDHEYLCK